MDNPLRYKATGVVDSEPEPFIFLSAWTKVPVTKVVPRPIKAKPQSWSLNCVGCRWRVPKSLGGEGIVCNGSTMKEHGRCPEWAISWFLRYQFTGGKGVIWVMQDVVEANQL